MSISSVLKTSPRLEIVSGHGAFASQRDPLPDSQFAETLREVAENLMSLADQAPGDRAEIVRTASDLVAGIADTV